MARLGPARVAGRDVITYTYDHNFPRRPCASIPATSCASSSSTQLPDVPTNFFHVHGFHISPLGNEDDICLHVITGRPSGWGSNLPARQ